MINLVATQLEPPPSSKIHPVFHVSHLKHFQGIELEKVKSNLLPLTVANEPIILTMAIIKHRNILHGGQLVPEMLIQR